MSEITPKLTVLMSVYNGDKFLGRAIESILNQTYQDFEFIIINNGSTDNSIQILKKYEQTDKRICFVCFIKFSPTFNTLDLWHTVFQYTLLILHSFFCKIPREVTDRSVSQKKQHRRNAGKSRHGAHKARAYNKD